jgi:hypothetical protein
MAGAPFGERRGSGVIRCSRHERSDKGAHYQMVCRAGLAQRNPPLWEDDREWRITLC